MKKLINNAVLFVAAVVFTAGIIGCDQTNKTALNLGNANIRYTGTLRVCNLIEYIDLTTLMDFEKEFAIKIEYEEFDNNEDLYNYISKHPDAYDVLILSDYTIDRLIQEGRVRKFEKSKVPNIANVAEEYLKPEYDINNDYVVPYMAGTIGILYNKRRVTQPIESWTTLFDTQYSGKVFMMDNMRDSIGVVLQMLGFSMNSSNDNELAQAKSMLLAARSFASFQNEIIIRDRMVAGEGVVGVIFSGEAKMAIDRNPDLDYVIPKEGAYKWVDGFVIMNGTQQLEAAQNFINFMCRPNIAVRNMTKIGYTSPIRGAWSEFGSNRIMFPAAEELEHCEVLLYDPQATQKYVRLWSEVR